MGRELLILAIPFLGCLANGAVQVASYRWAQVGHFRSILWGGLAGLAVLLAVSLGLLGWRWEPGLLGLHLTNGAVYIALAYTYFHFNNMGESARRIRLLRELHEGPPEGLTREELLARYDAREMIDRRLGRLLDVGQVVEQDGRLQRGQSAILGMQKLVALAKLIVYRGKSEFDHHGVDL